MIYNLVDFIVDVYVNGDLLFNDFVYCIVMLFVDLLICMDIDLVVVGENSNFVDDLIVIFEDICFNDG